MENEGEGESGAVSAEIIDSWSILIMLVLTSSTVGFAYLIQRTQFKFAHESFLAIFVGACVGLVIRVSANVELKALTQFNTELFFFLLLPPIIFNAGYDLRRGAFFQNFGPILNFAFIGTTASTFITGLLLYAFILVGVDAAELQLVDCLIFGALISATDPVLAIFHALHVDPKLFAMVFGESILNDAVAIVLFESLQVFKTNPVTFANVMLALGSFVGIFFGSFAIGMILGCFSALVFKHTYLHLYPNFESSIFVTFAYMSYLLAQGVGASGIVSMLFCGIAMSHYTYANLSLESQVTTKGIFRVLSFMSENFIFTYLGITIFARSGYDYRWDFIFATFFVLLISRACNIYPLAWLSNLFSKTDKIKTKHMHMMWWSGLRGAIAFALSMKVTGEQGPIVVTTTLMIVVITVVVFGGSTSVMLERLRIATHVEQGDDGDDLLNVNVRAEKPNWFVAFERTHVKPFFRSQHPPSRMGMAHGSHAHDNSSGEPRLPDNPFGFTREASSDDALARVGSDPEAIQMVAVNTSSAGSGAVGAASSDSRLLDQSHDELLSH